MDNARVPVIGIIGPKGSGKTTLLGGMIALLGGRGLRMAAIKFARADFDIDIPGKDSYELRKAGVEHLLLAAERKTALLIEHPNGVGADLNALLALLDQERLDLVLVEGFNEDPFPKIELCCAGNRPLRYPLDPWVVALASDYPATITATVPVFDRDDAGAVVEFILSRFLPASL